MLLICLLDTDASNHAIEAVLSQVQDDIERVVCYGSYVVTPVQRRYCVTQKELLAVVRFPRQFRHYFWGRKFLLRQPDMAFAFQIPGRTIG